MAREIPRLHPAQGEDWDEAWSAVTRLYAARKHVEHDADPIRSSTSLASKEHPSFASAPAQVRQRLSSVVILIGALWISVGMIVSAAIVAVAILI